jgi:hypothetical protein
MSISTVNPMSFDRIPNLRKEQILEYLTISELSKIRTVNKIFNALIDKIIEIRVNTVKCTPAYTKSGMLGIMQRLRNDFLDVIQWLQDEAYVVIRNDENYTEVHNDKNTLFFHKCTGAIATETQVNAYLKNHKIIYVDLSGYPSLFNEWNQAIEQAGFSKGFSKCTCALKERTSDKQSFDFENLPHSFFLQL